MLLAERTEPRQIQEVKLGIEKITGAVKVTGGGLLLVAGLGTMIGLAVLHWKVIIPLILLMGAASAGGKKTVKRLQHDKKNHPSKKHDKKPRPPKPGRSDRYV